tara:strand:+ start:832 stop:1146 length:315 start_codon:yes stop_codon:yes gene_type:complete
MAKTAKKKWYESYQPLNDYVLVKVIKEEEKTKGGLYKPESNKEQMKGEVLAVGSGIFTTTGTEIPMKLKVGDVVIVPNTGIQLKLDGEKLNLFREQEILMKING